MFGSRNIQGKMQGEENGDEKWKERKAKENTKNRFNINKLFLYATSNLFHLF